MSKERVNHPDHYNAGGVECIDALASATADLTGIEAFDTANAIKYLWRWKHKNGVEDLKKAKWYIDHLIELKSPAKTGEPKCKCSFKPEFPEELDALM